jgi:lipoic acid synthetase
MKPEWFRQSIISTPQSADVRKMLCELSLNTVCEEARCPNRNNCFAEGNATFMILGDTCTRNCSFCAVKSGNPSPCDEQEVERVAQASKRLGLEYVVITSLTRDDFTRRWCRSFR